MLNEDHIESPCQRLCAVDSKTGFCAGCYRTMKEIGAWGRISNAEKKEILAQLDVRREELGPIGYLAR